MALSLSAAGCGESSTDPGTCRIDEQCPAGERCADGICSLVIRSDGPSIEAGSDGGDGPKGQDLTPDAGADLAPDRGGADGALQCQANGDQVVDRSEMPVRVGASVKYTIGSGLTLDLRGSEQGGVKTWSLKENASDDAPTQSELLPIFEWARGDYPDATYVSLINKGYGAYGVFKVSDTSLSMLGVISKEKPAGLSGTNLPYGTPIEMVRFPLSATTAFQSKATASGTFNGVYLYVTETYDVKSLGAGKLELPQLTLDTVLLQVNISQVPYANPWLKDYRTIFLFVAECYGIVGRVVVEDRVDDLSQVAAKERWRLSF